MPSSVFGSKRPQQPHQHRSDRRRAASRAVTICRASGSSTRRASWPSATSTPTAWKQGKTLINGVYTKKTGKPYDGVTGYHNYHELLANKDIDAVVISTPDHQHAILAVDAVHAGKDVYLQKPASLTIAEGRP